MSKLFIYCFYDKVSNSFLPQFFAIQNDDVARRSFKAFVNAPQFPFRDIKDDLMIKRIGCFDIEKGLETIDNDFLCNVSDLIDKPKMVNEV